MAKTRPPIHLVAGIAAAGDPLRSQGQLVEWGRSGKQRAPSLFQLIRAFLGRARRDADFRFFLDHPAHMKPFWDTHPEERPRLVELRDSGRLGFACGLYRPIDSACASLELMIRTASHGLVYLEDYLGIPQHTFWHEIDGPFDPALLSVLAACGIEAGLVAASVSSNGSAKAPRAQRWLAPDGSILPIWHAEQVGRSYLALQRQRSPVKRARLLLEQVPGDATDSHRRLVPLVAPWAPPFPKLEGMLGALEPEDPEVRMSLPASLVPEASEPEAPLTSAFPGARTPSPETVLPDGGRAHHAASDALSRAESLATWASLTGDPYPAAQLDHGWRLLMASARREALTGQVNDQQRLDLLAGWRTVRDLAESVTRRAGKALAQKIDTRLPRVVGKSGVPCVVFNMLSWSRRAIAEHRIPVAWVPAEGMALRSDDGEELPFEVLPDTASTCRLRFLTPELPPMGHACVYLVPGEKRAEIEIEESAVEPVTAQTAHHRVVMDPTWGGGLRSIRDRALGIELLSGRQPGNELVVYPSGSARRDGPGSRAYPARVYRRRSPLGTTLTAIGAFERGWRRQEVRLYEGVARLDFRTELYGFDKLGRTVTIEFPFESSGRVPVVGRALGAEGVPISTTGGPWLEAETQRWAGWSAPIVVRHAEGTKVRERVVARVLIVATPELISMAESLVQALRPHGVTSSIQQPDRPPPAETFDLRIVLGATRTNPEAGRLIEKAHPSIPPQLADRRNVAAWIDPPGEQAALLLWANGKPLEQLVAKQVRYLEEHGRLEVEIVDPSFDRTPPAAHSIALANDGRARNRFGADGTMALVLCHLAEEGPVGRWPESPARRDPNGVPLGLGPEPRALEVSLLTGSGDWREADLPRAALEAHCPPVVVPVEASPGAIPRREAYLELESRHAIVTAVKRPGHAGVDRLLGRPLRRRSEIVVRIAEHHGRGEEARLKLPAGADSATWTDPTERSPLEAAAGKRLLAVPLTPHEIATLHVKLTRGLGDTKRSGGPAEATRDPETTTWWRSHPGAEPESFSPVSLLVHPAVWMADSPDPGELVVQLVSNRVVGGSSGRLEILGPPGWKLRGVPRKEILLEAGAERSWRIRFEPVRDEGLSWLRARWIPDADGGPVESMARFLIGAAPAEESPIAFRWLTPSVELAPGQATTLVGELENHTGIELEVIAETIAPFDLWEHVGPRQQRVTLASGASRSLELDIELPENTICGASWTVLKVTAAGETLYSEPASIRVEAPDPDGAIPGR